MVKILLTALRGLDVKSRSWSRFLWFALLCVVTTSAMATGSPFTAMTSGNWNDGATWGNASPGTAGVDFPSTGQTATLGDDNTSLIVIIPSGFTAAITTLTITTSAQLTIASGGVLSLSGVLTINDDGLGGFGILDISGTLTANQGSSFVGDSSGNTTVNSGGKYSHNFTTSAGNLLQANWSTGSTCEVIGYTTNTSPPGNLGQSFHHFTWNCASGSGSAIVLAGALTTVNGNLTVSATGGGTRTLQLFAGTSNNSLSVGGNILVNGSGRLVLSTSGTNNLVSVSGDVIISNSAAATSTMASTGSATITATNFLMNPSAATTFQMASLAAGSGTMTLSGNFTMSPSVASVFAMSGNTAASGTINLNGNFSINGNSSINTATTAGNSLNFTSSSVQTFASSGTIQKVNYNISANTTLDVGTSVISGTGSFTLNGVLRVGSTDALGPLQNNTSAGNLRTPTGTRVFNSGATVTYNGAAAQTIGDGHPTGSGITTRINNTSNVSLSASLVIVGTIILDAGNLSVGSNTLTMNGTFTPNGNSLITTINSNISIGGSGVFGTLTLSGSTTIKSFTMARTSGGVVTLGSNLTIDNTGGSFFTQTAGTLVLNGFTLTIGNDFTQSGGSISADASSKFIVNGSGTLPASVAISGSAINWLEVSRSSPTLSIVGTLAVTNLKLTDGTMSGTGLSMASGGTITRTDVGFWSGATPGGTSFNVTYAGAGITSGNELPSSTTVLNDLTVSSGSVTLSTAVTVNGTLLLNGGLISNSMPMDLKGALTVNSAPTITTSTVTFSGTTTLSGSVTPTFGAITITGTLTPSGNLQINGDLVNNGTLTAGSGSQTVTFGGTTTISGSSTHNFNNVTIAGNLTAPSTMNIKGNLAFNSGTFTHSSGTVVFNGTSSITGTPNFFNVTVTGTLNGPTSLNIASNFVVNGTFNPGTGTVLFNGSGVQVLDRTSGSAGTVNLYNVTVTKPSGTFRVQSSIANTIFALANTFTIGSGTTAVDFDGAANTGNFTFLSTATRTARLAAVPTFTTGSISGEATFQRYIQNDDAVRAYRYFASPVTTATGDVGDWKNEIAITGAMSDPSTGPGIVSSSQSMFRYNEVPTGAFATGWENYPNNASQPASSFALENGRGYAVYGRNTGNPVLDVKGTPFSGTKSLALTFTSTPIPADDGWNLIGNPYASAIDWDLVRAGLPGGITDAIYLKNNVGNDGGVGTGSYVSYVNGVSNGVFDGIIGSGQAFWVQTTSAATLTINESHKVTDPNPTIIRSTTIPDFMRIAVDGNGIGDKAVVYINSGASDAFDTNFDARHPDNDFVNLYTYIGSNTSDIFSINGISSIGCSKEINIGLTKGTASSGTLGPGNYTLTLEELSSFTRAYAFQIQDNFTGTTSTLTDGNSTYNFSVTSDVASYGNGRFKLIISESPINTALAVSGNNTCDANAISLTMPVAQSGISYMAYINNVAAGPAVIGNGSTLTIPVNALDPGTYTVSVKGSGVCSNAWVGSPATVTFSPAKTATTIDGKNCGGGSVTLKATGGGTGDSYKWYDVPDGGVAISQTNTGVYQTNDLTKTKTFYVSILSAGGCEGPRTQIKALITNYDPVIITQDNNKFTSSYAIGNQWFFNNEKMVGVTGQTITPDKPGLYAVEVTIGDCTTRTERVFAVTGLEPFILDGPFGVYPNPLKDKLTIRVQSEKIVPVTIHNELGVPVDRLELRDQQGAYFTGEWNASSMPSGMYIVRVQAGEKVYEKKVIKGN